MKVWIMRGIPGCGKDMFIRDFLSSKDPVVLSADDYHIHDGKYVFKPENLKAAHDSCLSQFVSYTMGHSVEYVVVNNTNIRMFEIAPYYRLAEAFGYSVQIIQFLCPPELGFRRNVHGVPRETVEQMARNMEPLPPRWNVEYMVSNEIIPLDI